MGHYDSCYEAIERENLARQRKQIIKKIARLREDDLDRIDKLIDEPEKYGLVELV